MEYEIWAGVTSANEMVHRFKADDEEKAVQEYIGFMARDSKYYHYALRRTLQYNNRRSGDI